MDVVILEILFGCFICVLNVTLQLLSPYFTGKWIVKMGEKNERNIFTSIVVKFFKIVGYAKCVFGVIYIIVDVIIGILMGGILRLLPDRVSDLVTSDGTDDEKNKKSFKTMISVYIVISIFYFVYTCIVSTFLSKLNLNEVMQDVSYVLDSNMISLDEILHLTLMVVLRFLQQIFSLGIDFLYYLIGLGAIYIIYASIIYNGMNYIDQVNNDISGKNGIFEIKSFNIPNIVKILIIGLVICLFLKIIISYNFFKAFFVIKNAFDIEINVGSCAATVVSLVVVEFAVDTFCGTYKTKKLNIK